MKLIALLLLMAISSLAWQCPAHNPPYVKIGESNGVVYCQLTVTVVEQGAQGIQGPAGPVGPSGSPGAAGQPGSIGPRGPAGVTPLTTLAIPPNSQNFTAWVAIGGAVVSLKKDGSIAVTCVGNVGGLCGIIESTDMGPAILVNIQPALSPTGGQFVVGAYNTKTKQLFGVQDVFTNNPITASNTDSSIVGFTNNWNVNHVSWQQGSRPTGTESVAPATPFPENVSIWFLMNAAADEFFIDFCGIDGTACYQTGEVSTQIMTADSYFLGTVNGPGTFYVRWAATATQLTTAQQ